MSKYMLAAFAAGFLCACVPGGISMDGGETATDTGSTDETGSDPGLQEWAEIRCVDATVGELCFGRLSGAKDAWSIVIQDCMLNDLIESGLAAPIDNWTAESCRAGEHPSELLPEWRCMTLLDRGSSVCYAGDGTWWTQVAPSCEFASGTVDAWPGWQCSGAAGAIDEHPWDDVTCYEDTSSTCLGVQNDDAVLIYPTCYVDQFAATAVPVCAGDIGETCPCDEGLICVNDECVAPAYPPGEMWGPCPIDGTSGEPTLCYGEDLACVPADFGEANICLPLGECPSTTPDYATGYEVGWGNACYPRCTTDADCGAGMVCGTSYADGNPMCAWPLG